MSGMNPKKKEKRSRSPSNESFVKNMTSRVSGLLPATITKWFSSPSSTNVNGSAPTADATDSSTEDEDVPEGPILSQPPLKRMRLGSPGKYDSYNVIEGCSSSTNNISMDACGAYDTLPSLSGRTTFRRERNFVSTPVMSSTEESSVENNDKKDINPLKPSHTLSPVTAPIPLKRKSLFDSLCSNESMTRAYTKSASNTMTDYSQPCFKPSLLGSPFYSGRTMYGGASSSYINQPNIKQTRNMLVNQSSSKEDNTISHSARRIMDLLEDYSSPLSEARRIPQFSRTVQKKYPVSSDTSVPGGNKTLSYKTQELHVPSIASILRLKKRSRLMDTTTAARQILASHSSTSDYPPFGSSNIQKEQTGHESTSKFTTKVKTKLSRPRRGDTDLDTELPTPVNLPSATLQIDASNLPKFSFDAPLTTNTSKTNIASEESNLPKFSFGVPLTTNTTSFSKPNSNLAVTENKTQIIETSTTSMKTMTHTPESTLSNSGFTFSRPVKLSPEAAKNTTTPPKFTFGSPQRSLDTEEKKDMSDSVQGAFNSKDNNIIDSDKSKAKDWKCDSCWVSNKMEDEKCVCCESPKPTKAIENLKTSKCSVCKAVDVQVPKDKCVTCELTKVNSVTPVSKATNSTKWKCPDCWVENNESAENCVCCGCKNPKNNVTNPAEHKAEPCDTAEKEWKCDDCWIKNKDSVDKCIACGGDRKNTKQSDPKPLKSNETTFKTPDSPFNKIVKAQTSKWECVYCLVRNDSDRVKCICCESERTGTSKEASKTKFNFGVNTSFKFGIDPKLKESVKSSDPKTLSDDTPKTKESETNNNTISQTPTFTFSLPSKKPSENTDLGTKSEENVNTTTKISFSFGIPKSIASSDKSETLTTSTPVTVPSIFSTEKKVEPQKIITEEKEQPQEVPKVDLPDVSKVEEAPKFSSPFLASFTAQTSHEQKPVSSFMATSLPPENNSVSGSVPTAPAARLPASETQQSTSPILSFSMPTKPITTNIFGSAATTVSPFAASSQNVQTAAKPLFEKPESATAMPTVPQFQKNDNSSLSTSLFQKPEATTAALPAPSLGATAPIFSFGSNTQSTTNQAEKPKFNFTFGSNNKTEPSSLFKNAFGGTDNSSATKFPMNMQPAAAGLGSGNLLNSSAPLTSNMLGGNGFASNNITSGGNEMSNNTMSTGNILQTGNTSTNSGNMFGTPVQKEHMWSSSNNQSFELFGSKVASNNVQKPTTFTFGTSTPFNAPSTAPTFGSTSQPSANLFGMPNQAPNNQGNVFSSAGQNQNTPNIFGSPQHANTGAPQAMGIFGTPSVGSAPAPAFGSPSAPIQPFESPSLTPAPAPAFNFGASQSTGVFGFGQGQTAAAGQGGSGIYTFGGAGAGGGAPALQFSMGSAPSSMAVRRVRKAVRRNNR